MEQNQMLLLQQLVIVQQGVSDEYEPKTLIQISKRAAGIEPASSAWKAEVLPLNYARESGKSSAPNRFDPAS
ncbi:MAG: hypothetical protein RLZZ89_221 [Cyanobacteriota bacterium]|jgi:hypothetical protein